jgi:hypothetical protein
VIWPDIHAKRQKFLGTGMTEIFSFQNAQISSRSRHPVALSQAFLTLSGSIEGVVQNSFNDFPAGMASGDNLSSRRPMSSLLPWCDQYLRQVIIITKAIRGILSKSPFCDCGYRPAFGPSLNAQGRVVQIHRTRTDHPLRQSIGPFRRCFVASQRLKARCNLRSITQLSFEFLCLFHD